jgi:uncharacterized membrane protein YkvI
LASTKKNTLFQRRFLPGFLFQSVIIGGGYATGRELVEFFLSVGPLAGLISILAVTACFSFTLSVAFELARVTRAYDYRTFFKQILGPAWFVYEIVFFALVILVIAVLGSASGELVHHRFGIAPVIGTITMMVVIGILVFYGTTLIERVLAGWSFLLYAVYAVLIWAFLSKFGHKIPAVLATDDMSGPWVMGTIRYVALTATAVTMILFCVRHMESRSDAFVAGALAGPIGMLPAIFFLLGMIASYPEILDVPVPSDYMMRQLDFGWLSVIFYVVVLGTFIETGTGMIHAINERIDHVFRERSAVMPRWLRPAIAMLILFFAVVLADRIGIIDLIAKGYVALAWIFLIVFLLPLLTVGVWRIWQTGSERITVEHE